MDGISPRWMEERDMTRKTSRNGGYGTSEGIHGRMQQQWNAPQMPSYCFYGGDDTTGDVMEPMSAMRAHFGWSGNMRAFAFNRRHLSHRNAA